MERGSVVARWHRLMGRTELSNGWLLVRETEGERMGWRKRWWMGRMGEERDRDRKGTSR